MTSEQEAKALNDLLASPGWKLVCEQLDHAVELAWIEFREARLEKWTTKKSVQLRADCNAAIEIKEWPKERLRALGWGK